MANKLLVPRTWLRVLAISAASLPKVLVSFMESMVRIGNSSALKLSVQGQNTEEVGWGIESIFG